MALSKFHIAKSPALILVFGFAIIIVIGALLLDLPAASSSGRSIGLFNAFFTSTSATCVIGMSAVDIGSGLSLFGQIAVLVLMQLGGIGIMTMTSFIYLIMGKRITLSERMVLSYSFSQSPLQGVVRLTRNVALITAVTEGIGIALFCVRLIPMYGAARGFYYSVYQSISAFCNVGFDVFGQSANMIPFADDILINVVTILLVVIGGLGFFVVSELSTKAARRSKKRLSLHTRMVLVMTAGLIAGGFVVFLISEWNNSLTLGAPHLKPHEKVMGALFQSVNARSAGFYTVDQSHLRPLSVMATIGLMFIGASPSGTGGGIKTTTIALFALFIVSILRGKEDVEVAKRRLNRNLVLRAVAITTLGIAFALVMCSAIYVIEQGRFSLDNISFEVIAAFGTTGLTTGVTAMFSAPSLVLMMLTMFGGRVGVFTFAMALSYRLEKTRKDIRYPEDKILIG
jgi:trk system potassium uptake protein TrkH